MERIYRLVLMKLVIVSALLDADGRDSTPFLRFPLLLHLVGFAAAIPGNPY
jgi:hypothetical protein